MRRGAEGASVAGRVPRQVVDAALQAGQARDRNAGPVRGVRGIADQPPGSSRGLRSNPVDARVSLQPFRVRDVSARHRVSSCRRAARTTRTSAFRSARVLDRRCGDHRDRRCILGSGAGQRPPGAGHPHRRPGGRDHARLAAGCDRPRTSFHGLHAGSEDHHVARRSHRTLHARRRSNATGRVALHRGRAGRYAAQARDAARAHPDRREPAP